MSADNAVIMNREQIENAIPHRAPMLLVDEVIEKSDSEIKCRKAFRADEFFLQGHYPGNPIVPGIILCEAAMQSGAILLSQFGGTGTPVATRLNDVRFKKIVRPDDTIEIDVQLIEKLANAFFMKAKVSVAGKLAARLEFACALAEKA